MGKGSLWRVEQQYKQNLIIALTRSSYHPNTAAMEKATASLKNPQRTTESPSSTPRSTVANSNGGGATTPARPFDAELFPHLSKFMADINGQPKTNGNDGIDENRRIQMHDNEHETRTINGNSNYDVQTMNVERIARDWGVDSIDDVNAATAMLALKHGPKVFSENFHTG